MNLGKNISKVFLHIFFCICFLYKCRTSKIITNEAIPLFLIGFLVFAISGNLYKKYSKVPQKPWHYICSGDSLLFLAFPFLVVLYVNISSQTDFGADIILVWGTCLTLMINNYTHYSFRMTAVMDVIMGVGAVWLGVSRGVGIESILIVIIATLGFISLALKEYPDEGNAKNNLVFSFIIFAVCVDSIISTPYGISAIAYQLINSDFNSVSEYLCSSAPNFLLVALMIVNVYHVTRNDHDNFGPEELRVRLLYAFLLLTQWSILHSILYAAISSRIDLFHKDRKKRSCKMTA